MDEDFDEFGNFIGKEYSESDSESNGSHWEDEVEVVENFDDEQDVNEPLVKRRAPVSLNEVSPPNWNYQFELMKIPALCRNFALIGASKHGKTSIANMLFPDFTDLRGETRNMTLVPKFTSTVHQTSNNKSFILSFADTPGHWSFRAEIEDTIKISDHTVLVVDACEGTKLSLQYGDPDLIVITKFDRLILDMRLTPQKAYERLTWLISELNGDWESCVFASAKFDFCFSLDSMTKLYAKYKRSTCAMKQECVTDYILTPIYKLFGCALTGNRETLKSLGISLKKREWDLGYDDRIKLIMSRYLETPYVALVDAIICLHPPTVQVSFPNRFKDFSTNSNLGVTLRAEGLMDSPSWIPLGSNRVAVPFVPAGCWYLKDHNGFDGKDKLTTSSENSHRGLVRIGIEALNEQSEASASLGNNLTTVISKFSGLSFKASETGEFWIYGPGELYLDTFLHELRKSTPKFQVSQPWAEFRETVSAESYVAIPTKTANGSCSITVIAQPLENCEVQSDQSVWCETGECKLVGPLNYDSDTVEAVIDGFKWCISHGPILESQIQNVCFTISNLEIEGSVFQLAPTTRRACCASVLVASPRLLEPEILVSVVGGLNVGKSLYSEIAKRNGLVDHDEPISGTQLYHTRGRLPLMDSFGLEIDIKCQSRQCNDSFVSQEIGSWITVTGDPLDNTFTTKRLASAEPNGRARDFMLKERRRKGLKNEPHLAQYVDADILPLLV